MKKVLVGLMIMMISSTFAQTLTGTWQVIKESNCMGDEFNNNPSEAEEELLKSMSFMSGGTPKTIQFNADGSGEENWRKKGKKKPSSKEKFLYRISDGIIYFLDKKSRLITNTYIIEQLTESQLLMFNKERSCERVELSRIN